MSLNYLLSYRYIYEGLKHVSRQIKFISLTSFEKQISFSDIHLWTMTTRQKLQLKAEDYSILSTLLPNDYFQMSFK